MKRILAMLLTMAMLATGMVMPAFAAEADVAALTDGEYEATVDGQMGPMTVKVVIAGGVIASVEVVSNNETPSFAGKALESIPAAIVAANSATVDTVSGATKTSNRIMSAVALCLEAAAAKETVALKDGEYEATVDGQMGPMTVKVVIAGGVIADVVVVSNNETPNFAAKALESIPAAIKAANSATVDTVSGATKTSNRIMNAVSLCLEEAGK